uniref:Ubiquitin-like domain-containing protein n=1 Tax=Alexandrium monilatum TaxID=311494 RepID=A0A7S4UE29_9DINO|mmetsp:Transcript_70328/g.209630  ORF Transcript_70328/g.209630 Transcript_70328/m.209630 type:complete len:217 (+) Transcript_70328:99-749(+)
MSEDNAVESLEIEVLKLTGDKVFEGSVLASSTVGELLSQMSLDQTAVKYHLLHTESGILKESEALGDHVQPPGAALTLVARPFFKVEAKDIAGAHTNNPAYFARENAGTEEEYLRLVTVCWFSVGGTFPDVPPNDYRIIVEAKSHGRLNLKGNSFDVSANKGQVASWDAAAVLGDEFREFEVGRFTQVEAGPASVKLDMRCGNWVSGFCWKSIYLK